MRTRSSVLLGLVFVLVLGMAAMAVGGPMPALRASRTAVTYPHSTRLMSSVATPSVIMRQLAGSSDWATYALVPSGVATTSVNRPTSTAMYEVVSDGAASDPVTISVAAQLSKPQVNDRGSRGQKLTVKGWVAPLHVAGNVQLTFFRWEKVSTTVVTFKGKGKVHSKTIAKFAWVQHGDPVDVSLTRQNSQKSKWSYKWSPSATGTWKVVVSHQDVAHVYSAASAKAVIRH